MFIKYELTSVPAAMCENGKNLLQGRVDGLGMKLCRSGWG